MLKKYFKLILDIVNRFDRFTFSINNILSEKNGGGLETPKIWRKSLTKR